MPLIITKSQQLLPPLGSMLKKGVMIAKLDVGVMVQRS
jgi:uncharacterized membrane protein YqaE (UPF0057 family)